MNDDMLDRLIDAERRDGAPPEPPQAAMWAAIDARAPLARTARAASRGGWLAVAGMAATLVVGFALGRSSLGASRLTSTATPGVAAVAAAPRTSAEQPFDRTTSNLLGETSVLIAALPAGSGDVADRRLAAQASQLLLTTRLLLDSPAAADPRLRLLLEDLELVLAQVARMRAGTEGSGTDLDLITEALQERELVPRIRTFAAQLAASAD